MAIPTACAAGSGQGTGSLKNTMSPSPVNSPTKTATSRPRKLRKLWKRTCQRTSRAHATAAASQEQPHGAIRLAVDRRRARQNKHIGRGGNVTHYARLAAA